MSFMFGVLGSVVFWAIYLPIGFIVGCMAIRRFAVKSWGYFKTGKPGYVCEPFEHWCMFLLWMVLAVPFWPALLSLLLIALCFKYIIGKGISRLVVAAGSCIPDITIKRKES